MLGKLGLGSVNLSEGRQASRGLKVDEFRLGVEYFARHGA